MTVPKIEDASVRLYLPRDLWLEVERCAVAAEWVSVQAYIVSTLQQHVNAHPKATRPRARPKPQPAALVPEPPTPDAVPATPDVDTRFHAARCPCATCVAIRHGRKTSRQDAPPRTILPESVSGDGRT